MALQSFIGLGFSFSGEALMSFGLYPRCAIPDRTRGVIGVRSAINRSKSGSHRSAQLAIAVVGLCP